MRIEGSKRTQQMQNEKHDEHEHLSCIFEIAYIVIWK